MRLGYIHIAACLLISLTSCEDRFDFLENSGFGVVVGLNDASVTDLSDSVKVSLKNGTDKYDFSLIINGEAEKTYDVEFTLIGFAQLVDAQGNEVSGSSITLSNGVNNFGVKVSLPSEINLNFSIIDEFGNTKTSNLNLIAFDNLSPIAMLDITSVKALSDFEYDLDASASFDQDEKFGGLVERYRYKIDTAVIFTDKSKIRIIFPSSGSFDVSLEVQDNDEAWSEIETQTFVVE